MVKTEGDDEVEEVEFDVVESNTSCDAGASASPFTIEFESLFSAFISSSTISLTSSSLLSALPLT